MYKHDDSLGDKIVRKVQELFLFSTRARRNDFMSLERVLWGAMGIKDLLRETSMANLIYVFKEL